MTCVVIIELTARPGHIESVEAWLRTNLERAKTFDGCTSVLAVRDQDDPASFILVEQFVTRAHYERYLRWRNDSGTVTELIELLDGPIRFRFCTSLTI